MPIRFRCTHCQGLMAISSRQAGTVVECPTCGEQTLVPLQDIFSPEEPQSSPPVEAEKLSEPPPDLPPVLPSDPGKTPLRASPGTAEAQPADKNLSVSPNPAEASDSDQSNDATLLPFTPGELDDDSGENPLSIRRRRMTEEEMDLTPMVDVTFQLLIFFMVSASFSLQKSIEVPLPDPDQQGASQQVQMLDDLLGTSIILKVDASNAIWIDDEPLGDPGRLADALRDKMRREQKTELLLTADSQSQHRTVIAVIDAANEAGMQKIRMTSRKKTD